MTTSEAAAWKAKKQQREAFLARLAHAHGTGAKESGMGRVMRIRLARKGDGAAIARLAELAIGDYQGGADPEGLGRVIDREGGRPVVPFGQALAFVAVEGEEVVGLAYVAPPVQLLKDFAEQLSEATQSAIARKLCALELLAVDASVQGRGIGTTLLTEVEEVLRSRASWGVIAKVTGGDRVSQWYTARGYYVGDTGMPFVLKNRVPLICSGEPGVRIAVKSLRDVPVSGTGRESWQKRSR
ncbi:GNAT family N-acetyltransferase [Streptomyces tubercidicus]|uniref:GNAT family N-acetyltransferase n=1 Tax=Streptomyces tubercidicus TaxID=47759 RepID=UPI003691607D